MGKFDSYGGCHFSNTLGEGNERSLIGKTTALYAVVIQFESESIVEDVPIRHRHLPCDPLLESAQGRWHLGSAVIIAKTERMI